MILAADSSGFHPTLAQLQAAYAQGVRVWGFYLPGPGIYSGDTQADFDRAHQAQMRTIGWASGRADPGQQKALAASWTVDYPTLDCEPSIRGDGPWTQPWLDTSGFGIYLPYGSDGSAFNGKRAPWFIMADYLGAYPYIDPQATWRGTAPTVPHGWQWAGTVNAFGGAVDRLWLDDFFAGTPAQGGLLMALSDAQQVEVYDWVKELHEAFFSNVPTGNFSLAQTYLDMLGQIASKQGAPAPGGNVTISGTFPVK